MSVWDEKNKEWPCDKKHPEWMHIQRWYWTAATVQSTQAVWSRLCWQQRLLPLCRDDHGFSPLHWACREGRSSVVDMLIMRGARINVMNRGDDTPLHLAASHGHRDIVGKVIFDHKHLDAYVSPEHDQDQLIASSTQVVVKPKWWNASLLMQFRSERYCSESLILLFSESARVFCQCCTISRSFWTFLR